MDKPAEAAKTHRTPHARSFHCILKYPVKYALLTLRQLAVMLLVLAPLAYTVAGGRVPALLPLSDMPVLWGLLLSLLLLVFVGMPMKYNSVGVLCRMYGHSRRKAELTINSYKKLLKASSRRVGRQLLWSIPLLALLLFFYIEYFVTPNNAFGKEMIALSEKLGFSNSTVMYLLYAALTLLSLLAAVLAWSLDSVEDYQPMVELGYTRARARAKDALKIKRASFIKVRLLNVLICALPVLVLAALVLLVTKGVSTVPLTGMPQYDVSIIINNLRAVLSSTKRLFLIVALALWLPLWQYRKLALCILTQRVCKSRDGVRIINNRL